MTKGIGEASPHFRARLAGAFYFLTSTASVFGQIYVLDRIVVSKDAVATSANVLANEPLLRLGLATVLIAVAFDIVKTVLFYDLFRFVSRSVSLLAAFVQLVACAIMAVSGLLLLGPLVVLDGGPYISPFTTEQVQALAFMFFKLNAQTFNIFLIFFGFWCMLIGYLVFRSSFLPRIIGVLMTFAGLGYLTYLWPPLASFLYPFNLALASPGELSLLLWLLVVGVNEQRWQGQAGTASTSMPA